MTQAEMNLAELSAREAIRELRVAYSTGFDTIDEEAVRQNFASDIVCAYPAAYGGSFEGADAVIDLFRQTWEHCQGPLDTLHLIANHSITLTGPDTAKGHCLLLDLITRQTATSPFATRGGHDNPLFLIGRYDDEYVRENGRWKFRRIALTALWPERH